jgi:hypothetical protein
MRVFAARGLAVIVACWFVIVPTLLAADASGQMGIVYVVKSDPRKPTTVFAAAQRGLFKSLDAGVTWTATALTEAAVALAIDPLTSTVFAGTSSGLLKSVDGGTSSSSAGVSGSICSVEVDPAIPTTLYASKCSQLLKSGDAGETWKSIGPTDGAIHSVAIAAGPPTVLYAVDGVGARVFSSSDGGENWSPGVNPDPDYLPFWGLYGFHLVIDPMTSTTVYVSYWGWSCDSTACFTAGAIGKSTDAGATWLTVERLLYYGSWVSPQVSVSPVAIDPLAPSVFYAAWNVVCDQFDPDCLGGGVSEDYWISKSTEGRIGNLRAYVLWFDALKRTVLYAATESGVFQSTDGGLTWAPLGDPPPPPTDTAPPDTSMSSAVDGGGAALANDATTLSASVTFSFGGMDDVAVARFECQRDGGGFSGCTSPVAYHGLPLGGHSFEVRAIDTSGNVDSTPARHLWTVDAAPETRINSAVDGRGKTLKNGGSTPSDRVTFWFAGTDNGTVSGFECRLDAGGFTSCTSPVTYTGLTRGAHTFRVRAIDDNAFRDPSPAAFQWTR